MKNKNYSIPLAMLFKRFYCAKCGARLKREKTHRIVSREDRDYYRYHHRGNYPQSDHDVYEYRFMCPACQARSTFAEQCILARIQKKNGQRVLSVHDVKADYEECRQNHQRHALIGSIVSSLLALLLCGGLIYLLSDDKSLGGLMIELIIFGCAFVILPVRAIRRHRGKDRNNEREGDSYSYEDEERLKRLHVYSTHNRRWVETADRCHCFYCKSCVEASTVTEYADDGQTAFCPKCDVQALLPDSIPESVDEETVALMNEYWF